MNNTLTAISAIAAGALLLACCASPSLSGSGSTRVTH
jgi:hypothetical protein